MSFGSTKSQYSRSDVGPPHQLPRGCARCIRPVSRRKRDDFSIRSTASVGRAHYAHRASKLGRKIIASLAFALRPFGNYVGEGDHTSMISVGSSAVNKPGEPGINNASSTTDTSSDEDRPEKRQSSVQNRLCYPTFVSRYLQTFSWIGENSLCRRMAMTVSRKSRIFTDNFALAHNHPRHEHQDFVYVACVLIKLKNYLQEMCQRANFNPNGELFKENSSFPLSSRNSHHSLRIPEKCDKGIQCSEEAESLQLSPDFKFFSRSSLVINVDQSREKQPDDPKPQLHRRRTKNFLLKSQAMSTPSFEYVAEYKPEFHDGISDRLPRLRSFSSTATFDMQNRESTLYENIRPTHPVLKNKHCTRLNHNRNRQKQRVRASTEDLEKTIRRTEDELIQYSNLIEDDLSTFRHSPKVKTNKKIKSRKLVKKDIHAVKKILLEDYMTEVKEIIRSKSSAAGDKQETQMLESVKRRMDEDLTKNDAALSLDFDNLRSMPSCNERQQFAHCQNLISHLSARKFVSQDSLCCYCCCCCCSHHCAHSSREQHSANFCPTSKGHYFSGGDQLLHTALARNHEKKRDVHHVAPLTAKSTQSLDSGVLMDYSRPAGDSSDELSRREDDSGSASCSQNVELAMRKFTEELILCERRTRERSSSKRREHNKRRSYSSAMDQNTRSSFKNTKNSCYLSDDEFITDISTPSLVSLTDSDSSSMSEMLT